MLGLSGTLSYAVYVSLCLCVFVFVYLCMRHLGISVQISFDLELSENVWFVWSKTSLKWYFGHGDKQTNEQPGEPRASLPVEQ